MMAFDSTNEQMAAAAFSKQALVFDAYDAGNAIIHYKRERVREHVLRYLAAGGSVGSGSSIYPGGSILELNAGTGEDAVFFARQGYRVHATDIAEGMLEALRAKVQRVGLTERVTSERCSFTALGELNASGPYDLIFSNFAGLNCTQQLGRVLGSLSPLLKPGGQVTLVILPPFSLWEALLVFRGKFRTAFRRFFSRRSGAPARVEGLPFRCWYYAPSFVVRAMRREGFELLGLEGLCTLVPPSYVEHFAERHPRAYRLLREWEGRWKDLWPWRIMGDYYIVTFRKGS